jgi:hypothetical protein
MRPSRCRAVAKSTFSFRLYLLIATLCLFDACCRAPHRNDKMLLDGRRWRWRSGVAIILVEPLFGFAAYSLAITGFPVNSQQQQNREERKQNGELYL